MARFYRSPTWKHLITRRDSTVVTDLSRLASNRRGHFELGGPSFFEGFVPSHDFRVFFPTDDEFPIASFDPSWADDHFGGFGFINHPRLQEGMRLMYSFRRDGEGEGGSPWSIRHAGPILEIEDNASPDRRLSRFTAYDPWAYLYQRPARLTAPTTTLPKPDLGSIPGEAGVVFPADTTGNTIVGELLRRTIDQDGPCYIDAGTAFGGTAFYGGTLETTLEFVDPVVFPRGVSVGTAWEQMVDTGTLDIVLTPIFDPFNRPGYCAELNIFNQAGGDPGSVFLSGYPTFNWDRSGRALIEINRLQDGRERANRIRAYQGGTGAQNAPWTEVEGSENGAPDAEASWSDAASATRYGESWHQETYVRQTQKDLVSKQARNELIRRRLGLRTWRMRPTPEFSPRPFQDYMPGSPVGFYHSSRLRDQQWWQPNELNDQTVFPRIFAFDIELSDDSLESVGLLDVVLDVESAGAF